MQLSRVGQPFTTSGAIVSQLACRYKQSLTTQGSAGPADRATRQGRDERDRNAEKGAPPLTPGSLRRAGIANTKSAATDSISDPG